MLGGDGHMVTQSDFEACPDACKTVTLTSFDAPRASAERARCRAQEPARDGGNG